MSGKVIHPEHLHSPFVPVTDEQMSGFLYSEDMAWREEALKGRYPDLSVVIQSCLDSPKELEALFEDFDRQDYPPERLQYLVVGEVSPDTRSVARHYGVEVIPVARTKNFRAELSQRGLEASRTDLVYTTIGHVALPHNKVLANAAAWGLRPEVAGAYGMVLPGANASVWERMGARMLGARRIAQAGPQRVFGGLGMLAADSSVVKRELALAAGGYPNAYGAGGADGQLGEKLADELINGRPYRIMRDPIGMAVVHTHGLGMRHTAAQARSWLAMSRPSQYDAAAVDARHPRGGL